jgi:hypothetical protein
VLQSPHLSAYLSGMSLCNSLKHGQREVGKGAGAGVDKYICICIKSKLRMLFSTT